jgi:hypothetical protein
MDGSAAKLGIPMGAATMALFVVVRSQRLKLPLSVNEKK